MLLEADSPVIVGVLLIALILQYIWSRFCSLHGIPPNLPWAGVSSASFVSRFRASGKSLFELKGLIEDGYETHSKNGQAFVLPNIVTGPEVILPNSQTPWLMSQPDSNLSQHEVNKQFLDAERTMLHPRVSQDTVHGRVIRREMTKDLDSYSDDIVDEIELALKINWGTDLQEWKEVALYDTMLNVMSRISNRVLVGAPLCRDPSYLKHSSTFARNVVITAGIINILPALLQPILSPLILAYDYFQYWRIKEYIFPIVKKRARSFRTGLEYKKPDYSQHNDYIQWALHDAYSHDDPSDGGVEMITKRLTVLSFAAIQSSVITITNCLFDIASSDCCKYIQDTLREEVDVVLAQHTGLKWKKASLAAMRGIDSALRESMRLWGFISRGVMKKVVAPGGIILPSGERLPYGAKVGVTSYAIHHDEDIYPQAMKYDALRFARENITNTRKIDTSSGVSMVTSSDTFMAFSHGRHACPGRFFAANQLKLLLAAIVTKYEIDPIATRPVNPWLNNTIGPPMWSKLRVRRRLEPVDQPFAPIEPTTSSSESASHSFVEESSLCASKSMPSNWETIQMKLQRSIAVLNRVVPLPNVPATA